MSETRPLSARYGLTEERIVVIGASNPEVGRMVGTGLLGFIDRNESIKTFCGKPVWGWDGLDPLIDQGCVFINGVSRDTKTRKEVTDTVLEAGGRFINLTHPSVDLTDVRIGQGVYIQEGCIIQAGCEIGDMAALHLGCLVAHGTKIGAHAFTTAGTLISGDCEIGEGAFIGVHATVLPRLKVGAWATVGAGAVVTKDVPGGATVVGVPAQVLKSAPW